MAGEMIMRIGPVAEGREPDNLYQLVDADGAILAEVRSAEDIVGVRSLATAIVTAPSCESLLAQAADVLDLAIGEPTRAQNEAKGDAAISLAGSDLPQTSPPVRRRTLLQGLGALLDSPAWERLGKEETAMVSLSGCFEDEEYDLGISLARVPGAVPDKIFVVITDFAATDEQAGTAGTTEMTVTFLETASFLVQALRAAYSLTVMPRIQVEEQPITSVQLGRLGPALGAACYTLSDLRPEDGRLTMAYDENAAPMHLRISAGFGPAGLDRIFR